jgi:hypothetical protein
MLSDLSRVYQPPRVRGYFDIHIATKQRISADKRVGGIPHFDIARPRFAAR